MSINRKELRERQREKRVTAAKERRVDFKNAFSFNDPTPYNAILNIIREGNQKEDI